MVLPPNHFLGALSHMVRFPAQADQCFQFSPQWETQGGAGEITALELVMEMDSVSAASSSHRIWPHFQKQHTENRM